MSVHGDAAQKALKTITGNRTNAVKATVALVHATLDAAAATREQTAKMTKLWNEDK